MFKHSALIRPALAFLLVFVAWWWFAEAAYGHARSAGEFGDLFGGINALFAGAALVGVVIAIGVQQKELRLSHYGIQRQAFETTFFHVLRLHHDNVQSMALDQGEGSVLRGRELLLLIANQAETSVHGYPPDLGWAMVFEGNKQYLSHYLRNLYHVFKLIDESNDIFHSENDRMRFAAIARAQLSDPEHRILFYNGLGEQGRKKFKRLIEKYHLLENLDYQRAVSKTPTAVRAYEPSAYGEDWEDVEHELHISVESNP